MDTIKKKSTKKLPSADWTYHVAPGAPSIKGSLARPGRPL
jgi:alkaline phosphatase D